MLHLSIETERRIEELVARGKGSNPDEVIAKALRALERGEGAEEGVSFEKAAARLDVPEAFIPAMIERGELTLAESSSPSRPLVSLGSLKVCTEKVRRDRMAGMIEMMRESQEMGLYD